MVLTEEQHTEASAAAAGEKRPHPGEATTSTTATKAAKHGEETAQPEEKEEKHESDEGEGDGEGEEGSSASSATKRRGRGRGRGRGSRGGTSARGRAKGRTSAAAGKKAAAAPAGGEEQRETRSRRMTSSSSSATMTSSDVTTLKNVLEKGRIFFFYRPRVDHDEVHEEADIQRMYLELVPDRHVHDKPPYSPSLEPNKDKQAERTGKHRLLLIPRKQLPNVHAPAHLRKPMHWGFVDMVADTQEELNHYLEGQTYQTKKRGTERNLFPARCVGEGLYELVMFHNAVHLAYVLTDPAEPGEAQKDLNVFKEGSFIVRIKNPQHPTPMHVMHTQFAGFHGLTEEQHAHYSRELQNSFHSKAHPDHELSFASDEHTPQMLNVQHTEFLLIAASDDIAKELSVAGKYLENKAERVIQQEKSLHVHSETHVRTDLHLPSNNKAPATHGQNRHDIDTHPVQTKQLE